MQTRNLGDLTVSKIGFGTMSFAGTYGEASDKAEAVRVIRGAHEQGVTLFDTAEAYGPFTNEVLVGEALAPIHNQVVIATKFVWNIDSETGERKPGLNSRPDHVRRAVEGMLKRLNIEKIGPAVARMSWWKQGWSRLRKSSASIQGSCTGGWSRHGRSTGPMILMLAGPTRMRRQEPEAHRRCF